MSNCACGRRHIHGGCARPDPVGAQVALSGHLACADAAQLMTLLMHVGPHVAATQAEPGCLYAEIAQTDDPLLWRVETPFRDADALAAHRARSAASLWAAASAGIAGELREIAAEGKPLAPAG